MWGINMTKPRTMKRRRPVSDEGDQPKKRMRPYRPSPKTVVPDGEVKFLDTQQASMVIPAAGVLSPNGGVLTLVQIPQGVAQNNRDGRKVMVKSININGIMTMVPGMNPAGVDLVRIIIILDKQANGGGPAITDILSTADINSFNNLDNTSRFRTLSDERFEFNSTAGVTTAYNDIIKFYRFNKKVNLPIEYDSSVATGAIGSIRSNNLLMLALSVEGFVSMAYTCRIRFVG